MLAVIFYVFFVLSNGFSTSPLLSPRQSVHIPVKTSRRSKSLNIPIISPGRGWNVPARKEERRATCYFNNIMWY